MVFSGHANTALCFALIFHTYYKWVPQTVNVVKTSVWIYAIIACILLCSTRTHYLLDVVLSFYFSLTIWTAYHRLAIDVNLGHRFISVWMFDHVLLYPMVEFMELPLKGETAWKSVTPRNSMNLFDLQLVGIHLDDVDDRHKLSVERKGLRPRKGTEDILAQEEKKDS